MIIDDGVCCLLHASTLRLLSILLFLLLLLIRCRYPSSFSLSRGCCRTLPVAVLHPVALYLLPPMDRVLLLHLLPSTSVPPMPPFELFFCSSLVTADDDDDDVVDCDIISMNIIIGIRCLSFSCIPKSIFVVSTNSIV